MKSRKRLASLQLRDSAGNLRKTALVVELANTFWTRLAGLLGRRFLPLDRALLLDPCTSIHTLGMRFTIDIVFLDAAGRVIGYSDHVVPNRFRFAPKGTRSVLEIADGNRTNTGICLDDQLIFD